MTAPVRSVEERQDDTRRLLEQIGSRVWIASANEEGNAHLVPLSFSWDGELLTISSGRNTLNATNILAGRQFELGLGTPQDVVRIGATLDQAIFLEDAPTELLDAFATQAGWGPGGDAPSAAAFLGPEAVLLRLRPERVEAWRGNDELSDRFIMRDGSWVA